MCSLFILMYFTMHVDGNILELPSFYFTVKYGQRVLRVVQVGGPYLKSEPVA